MDSNNTRSLGLKEQSALMQQRLIQLEHYIQHQPQTQDQVQAQAATDPPSSTVGVDLQANQDIALHSLEVCPSFNWTPSSLLSEVLGLDSSLFASPSLTNDEKASIAKRYPPMDISIPGAFHFVSCCKEYEHIFIKAGHAFQAPSVPYFKRVSAL